MFCGTTADLTTSCWLKLREGESFTGSPAWVREESVLVGVSGGEPKRDRLFCTPPIGSDTPRRGPLFTAEHGGKLMSWDHSQEDSGARVAVVHRLANAMLAEVVLVAEGEAPTVLAVDCRVEYSRPQVAFLASGALLLRLNALIGADKADASAHLRDAAALQALPRDAPKAARHGLWLMTPENFGLGGVLTPVSVMAEEEHGTYDVYTGTYGRPGADEGFRLDPGRSRAVVTARRTGTEEITYADDIYHLEFGDEPQGLQVGLEAVSGKGCNIPVALSATELVYHHRSPTESGDLWRVALLGSDRKGARLTQTMPLSLQRKLLTPTEVTIRNDQAPRCDGALPVHAQVFAPEGDGPLQPLLWVHGGPLAQYAFDFNPLLSWLASCGYYVMAPNVSGSTGNGLGFMNRVLDEGCGVADLSDCLACAEWLKTDAARQEPRLDLSRGVAVAGHSWGGYLAFMCMLQQKDGESVFSCGVAAAGITDWFVQQRHTEVRYYDYALMGGWVYEKEIAARAREVSPLTKACDLRAPILILHGDKDIDVPFQQIPPFVEAAKRSPHPGASVEYHPYPGEGHGMASTEAQADYLKRVETFLRINLKPWDFTSNPHGDLTAY